MIDNMLNEYKGDEDDRKIISEYLCSLSNEQRTNAISFAYTTIVLAKEIVNRTEIGLSEFEIIVRMCAVQKGVVDDDMKTNTQEMMKMKTHYELEFTRHNMITQEHRISYMLNQSFRVPAVPSPATPTFSCPCGKTFKSEHGKNHYNHINSDLHKAYLKTKRVATASPAEEKKED